jgi:putative SOS response-associated peptidase YedK
MCGRVIQASGPLRLAIVDGLDVRDSRLTNVPRRYNAAPSQELLVIRQNHQTGERSLDFLKWGLIPYWCKDPKGGRRPINAKAETVSRLPRFGTRMRGAGAFCRWMGSSSGRRSKARRRSSPLPSL